MNLQSILRTIRISRYTTLLVTVVVCVTVYAVAKLIVECS